MSGFNKYYYQHNVRRGKAEANEMPLKEFLDLFFKRCHIDYSPYEEEIKQQFINLTGQMISNFITYINLKNKILYVRFSSPTVKAEIMMLREALKNRINENIGANVLNEIILY